jgi:hypothetical protein
VHLHVGLDAVVELGGGVGELARRAQHQADLDRLLRVGGAEGGGERRDDDKLLHLLPSS